MIQLHHVAYPYDWIALFFASTLVWWTSQGCCSPLWGCYDGGNGQDGSFENSKSSLGVSKSIEYEIRGGADDTGETEDSWSSLFSIDPSKILPVLIRRGGLVMPKNIQKELLSLSKFCHTDLANLNLVKKRLELRNVTISFQGTDALRIGRICLKWESYTKPCIDVEVDDVDISLEFTNLMLTDNNWKDLNRAGFPPPLATAYATSESPETSSLKPSSSPSFLRIGGLQLSGRVAATLTSRPLDRQLARLNFDLDSLYDMNERIQNISNANLQSTGRRGCDTVELYDIIQSHFVSKISKMLASTAKDLASNPFRDDDTETVANAKRLLLGASDAILSYAGDAGKKKGEGLRDHVERAGSAIHERAMDHLKRASTRVTDAIEPMPRLAEGLKRFRHMYQECSERLRKEERRSDSTPTSTTVDAPDGEKHP
eukprot:CAMPEP_0194049636 /NCGR_PEP_ID=MMETSP0009_2-20130614/30800_1 /TAXON_ID=210454 /ORGANISM="Grammatophora oceanica, Strain CCMP 410" /LENGTH=428 /DNA_ID=CAMNT_0038695837 /DNA_START=97 /DNA_END=1383 /DNA_ORIENTATION=+